MCVLFSYACILIGQVFIICRYIFVAMYSFVPPFREAKFCVVPSCVFDKVGCVAGDKRLRNTGVEVCTGSGLARGSGLGMVAQIIFGSVPGSGLVQRIAIKCIEHFEISRAIIFSQRKLFVVALILCSWHSRAMETNPTDLIYPGILVAAPSQK
jgi:hypothetical protein